VFVALQNALVRDTDFYWKDAPSEIMEDTNIHPSAFISSKSVRIGHRVVIGPNASVLERTILGDDVTIRAGCVVGTEGFEFKRIGGEILPVFHDGGVRLGNRVEVQANTCISRGLFGATTEIGDDTKIDNLVHVAHNVRIGKRCLIAANAMLGGSATLGDDVWIGPGAQISSGVRIGDRASVTLGSVVTKDVAPGERVTGNFAIKHEKFIDFIRSIR
jgi:UDP-3-O-[3-hydroxymyristoyl] glucosamine N-acyltransferase